MDLEKIKKDTRSGVEKLLEEADLDEGQGVVIGGSTSEIMGDSLGSATNIEVGQAVVKEFIETVKSYKLQPIIQCCEHINRALLVEKDYARLNGLEEVNVVPTASAGGGFAVEAMKILDEPVVVERVEARAGVDIGDVFIGMHIKGVGVVVRPETRQIGQANLTMIRTRQKLIGGDRARHK